MKNTKLARWKSHWDGGPGKTYKHTLRAGMFGTGRELDAYWTWENPRSVAHSQELARAIEDRARKEGYRIYDKKLDAFV